MAISERLAASDETTATDAGSSSTPAGAGKPARRVWMAGLWPAFRDTRSGETHLARTAGGQLALQHVFDGLPDHWVVERDAEGQPLCLDPAIRAGYWRSPDFFALDATLALPLDS